MGSLVRVRGGSGAGGLWDVELTEASWPYPGPVVVVGAGGGPAISGTTHPVLGLVEGAGPGGIALNGQAAAVPGLVEGAGPGGIALNGQAGWALG
jgi:hypothetical protein